MPVQKTQSKLSKLGPKLAEAFAAHKDDPTEYGKGGNLPEGIEGGIAQISEIKFDEYKEGDMKGKLFFYAAGIVKSPVEINGIRTLGLRTSIMEPLCDTPSRARKTVKEHMGWVMNELRKLGLVTTDLPEDGSGLEPAVEALKQSAPHFHFRTWKSKPTTAYPNPGVNHSWEGETKYTDESTNGDGVQDDTAAEAATESAPWDKDDLDEQVKAADSGDADAATALTKRATALGINAKKIDTWTEVADAIREKEGNAATEENQAEAATGGDEVNWAEVGEVADGDDEDASSEAIGQLEAQAHRLELDPNDYPDCWTDLANAIVEKMGGAEPAAEEAAEFSPSVNDIYDWLQPGTKKAVEIEVTAVDLAKKTMTVKRSSDNKKFANVPFSQLV